jgi:biopolymer transport protein ExbB
METQVVENPYGLMALINQGGVVAISTLVIMVIMSAGSWFIMFSKWWETRKMLAEAKTLDKAFWGASNIQEGTAKLGKDSAYRYIAEAGLRASTHHDGKLTDEIDLHEWVSMSLSRAQSAVTSKLKGGMSFLATVGSTAPFVGLFGTVWGIYNALVAIGVSGQASIDKVAGPVGEALIMTAIGLAVAVPAVMGYNWLGGRSKVIGETMGNFAADLHQVLLSGSGSRAAAKK